MTSWRRALAVLAFIAGCGSSEAAPEPESSDSTAEASNAATEQRPEDLVDAGAGTTWTALYRDLFGPTGVASCAGSGMCHGSPDESGARGSNGYVCASREACRASMLSVETGMVQASDAKAPEKSTLVVMLRRRTAAGAIAGTMPKRSEYVFSRDSIARVETWIRNGASDD